MTDTKQQASLLRQQGHTYPEISQALGVSVDWCKRNLKGVEYKKKDACVEELIHLATKPGGISDYEATGVVFKYHADANREKVRAMKKKAKQINSDCIFRPDWLDPSSPTKSFNAINAYAIHLMDEIDTLVRHYTETFPDTRESAVKYELLKLSCSRLISNEPLSSHLYRTEKLVEEMENNRTS